MKRAALTFAALTLTAGAAIAADLPSRKGPPVLPPPPPPPPMWTGFYIGLNAGGTWANSNQQTIAVAPIGADANWATLVPGFQPNYVGAFAAAATATGFNSANNSGFIGGGQIGYNWQFMNSLVVGVEADIQGIAGNNTSRTFITTVPIVSSPVDIHAGGEAYSAIHSVRGSLDYLGTVRGRLGWLATPTLLLYGTGGLAYGGVTLNTATSVVATGSVWAIQQPASFGGVNFSNTQTGWTAGGGLEWMFWPNWSAKVEYLYYDLGSINQNYVFVANDPVPPAGNASFGGQARARLNGNIVRAGLNYHFNWGAPAPVVAKY